MLPTVTPAIAPAAAHGNTSACASAFDAASVPNTLPSRVYSSIPICITRKEAASPKANRNKASRISEIAVGAIFRSPS